MKTKLVNTIVAEQIRRGKVTVEIPGLDMDQLMEFLHSEAVRTLEEIAATACAEEMTAREKVEWIQARLT